MCDVSSFHFIIDAVDAEKYFSFIPMDIHANVEEVFLPPSDEFTAGPIEIPGGLPFGTTTQTLVYVSRK